MARVNDNLFTVWGGCGISVPERILLKTRWGRIGLRVGKKGLSEVHFIDHGTETDLSPGAVRKAFLHGLFNFEQMDAATQWACLDPRGTEFQKAVWRVLLTIPFGKGLSYGRIAADMGRPGAARAVGSAVAANPIALLIPCHRVRPSNGQVGNYRWGAARKFALLEAEQEAGAGLRSLFE